MDSLKFFLYGTYCQAVSWLLNLFHGTAWFTIASTPIVRTALAAQGSKWMDMAHFSDSFLEALGSWQNGWGEDQARRISLAQVLLKESQTIPSEFRTVSSACFRKRFLLTGEVVPLLLRSLHDGVTSWSTNRKFAEEFKYRMRPGTIAGVVFKYTPKPNDVILNISTLQTAPEFRLAVDSYRTRALPMANALVNFVGSRDQHEVVLNAPLNPEDIVTLSGETNTSFNEFCNVTKLPVLLEDFAWKALLERDLQPQAPSLIRDAAAQAAVLRVIERFEHLLGQAHRH